MRDCEAITVWCDESEVQLQGETHHIIGTLITDSDVDELKFQNEILKLRKKHKI